MANKYVEIHDPHSNHNNLKKSSDSGTRSTSDSSNMEDTVEFRILMAYATRRRPKMDEQDSPVVVNGNTDTNGTDRTEQKETNRKKKKKKNRGWRQVRRALSILKCVKPQTEAEEPQQPTENHHDVDDRSAGFRDFKEDKSEEEDKLGDVASRLARIADEIPFTPPEIETDGPDHKDVLNNENVERLIGLILRESGDRLNEQELKNAAAVKELFWDYSFFKLLITTLLSKMGLKSPNPESPGPHASPKTQIAVTCEATSRLSAMDTLPMNQLLGFGARYLQDNHLSWVKEQGGYEAAFESDDEGDVE